jgi:RND family efflux transporter MFP subunit
MQRTLVVVFLLAVFCWSMPLVAESAGIEAVSMPQADIFLGFVTGGLVARVVVKEGDRVKKGTLLARLNDTAERIELERLTALAEDTTRLESGEADLAQKRVDLKKLEMARDFGAATELEIEHALLAVTTAVLQVRMEKFERLQHRHNRDALNAKLRRMQIVSSVSGGVEEIKIEKGESVEALSPVIRVVQNNPLWVDVPVPMMEARGLKLGQKVKVSFPETPEEPGEGKIVFLATVADAASDTRRVRVEIPNPQERMAGERVLVDVSQP